MKGSGGMTLKMDDREIKRLMKASPTAVRRAAADTMNLAGTKVVRLTARAVGGELRVPQRVVVERTKFRKAAAQQKTPRAVIRVVTWKINPAVALNARELKRGGVSARGGYRWPKSFIATSPRGKRTVYTRKADAPRLPLSIEGIQLHNATKRALKRISKEEIRAYVNRQFPRRLRWRMRELTGR